MKTIVIYLITILLITSVNLNNANCQEKGSFTDDRDGRVYKTVVIGNQTWMAENMNYFVDNGSCCYDDNIDNCKKYGRLYNWETAKKVCPSGWHLPSQSEFETLLSNVGGEGSKAYYALKQGGNSGFSTLFGGTCHKNAGYRNIEEATYFWSSSPYKDHEAWLMYVFYSNIPAINNGSARVFSQSNEKENCFSVRCLQDQNQESNQQYNNLDQTINIDSSTSQIIPDIVYTKKQFIEDAGLSLDDDKYREVQVFKPYGINDPTKREKDSIAYYAFKEGEIKFIEGYVKKWFEKWTNKSGFEACEAEIVLKYIPEKANGRISHYAQSAIDKSVYGAYVYVHFSPAHVFYDIEVVDDINQIAVMKNIRCYK